MIQSPHIRDTRSVTKIVITSVNHASAMSASFNFLYVSLSHLHPQNYLHAGRDQSALLVKTIARHLCERILNV